MRKTQEENVISMFQAVITSLFKRSVMNMGIRLYNEMPIRIKQLDSFRDFKRKLKLFLLDHPFYSLNLKKIIEPICNNTSKKDVNWTSFNVKESYYYVITLVYWIINHMCVVD